MLSLLGLVNSIVYLIVRRIKCLQCGLSCSDSPLGILGLGQRLENFACGLTSKIETETRTRSDVVRVQSNRRLKIDWQTRKLPADDRAPRTRLWAPLKMDWTVKIDCASCATLHRPRTSFHRQRRQCKKRRLRVALAIFLRSRPQTHYSCPLSIHPLILSYIDYN